MKTIHSVLLLLALAALVSSGCARRMVVGTGTTIGLNATPGDGQSQPPQVTLAYKRAEIALVPTGSKAATKKPDADCYSALAIVDFRTRWFRETALDQFIATGHAARDIQTAQDKGAGGNEFTSKLVKYAGSPSAKTLRDWVNSAASPAERKDRQKAIADWIGPNADYNFADLLTDSTLERERQRFLKEKGSTLNILPNP